MGALAGTYVTRPSIDKLQSGIEAAVSLQLT